MLVIVIFYAILCGKFCKLLTEGGILSSPESGVYVVEKRVKILSTCKTFENKNKPPFLTLRLRFDPICPLFSFFSFKYKQKKTKTKTVHI